MKRLIVLFGIRVKQLTGPLLAPRHLNDVTPTLRAVVVIAFCQTVFAFMFMSVGSVSVG